MTDPREIELKLEPDQLSADGLVDRLSASIGTPRDLAKRLTSEYFDTRKHALHRRGMSLRVRNGEGARQQTLKLSDGGGTFNRAEWKSAVEGSSPDPDRFDQKTPRAMLKARGTLKPVFRTEVERTVWDVRKGRSDIEVSFDHGHISADGTACSLAEVELELKEGLAADLFSVARDLAKDGTLKVGVKSKSERGYDLLARMPAVAAKAEPVDLARKMSAGRAFQIVARSCLRQFRLNEPIMIETCDADALHQARVAIRRLRSAISIFKAVVADEKVSDIRLQLKELSVLLGDARNLDVYRAHMVAPGREPHPGIDAPAHEALIAREREEAYRRVRETLATPAFRISVLDLAGWIETGAWLDAPDNAARGRAVTPFAGRVLRKRSRAILKIGRHLDRMSPAERHEMRIAAKKLRYASEFFRSLVKGKRAEKRHRSFISALEQLQQKLGALNDLHTGRQMVDRLAAVDGDLVVPARIIHDEQDVGEDALVRSAVVAYRRFATLQSPLA